MRVVRKKISVDCRSGNVADLPRQGHERVSTISALPSQEHLNDLTSLKLYVASIGQSKYESLSRVQS